MTKKTMPTNCPGCGRILKVVRLACDNCGTGVEGDFDLSLLGRLDTEDQEFILSLLKSSGSLKDLARVYGISYPTVRNRLDVLIEKVKSLEAKTTQKKGLK